MVVRCNLLKHYKFEIEGRFKNFCPNCFRSYSPLKIGTHFGGCPEIPSGKNILEEDGKILLVARDDIIFRSLLRQLNKFLNLYTDAILKIPYTKNYDYWILQHKSFRFGKLTIGIAYVRFKPIFDRFVLAAVVIFPKQNTGKGYGKWFIKNINKYYKRFGGVIIESPNNKSLSLAKSLGIDCYYYP